MGHGNPCEVFSTEEYLNFPILFHVIQLISTAHKHFDWFPDVSQCFFLYFHFIHCLIGLYLFFVFE